MSPREKLRFWESLNESAVWQEYVSALNERINQNLINGVQPIDAGQQFKQEWDKGFTAGMMHCLATIDGMMESLRIDISQENQNVQAPTDSDE